MTGEGHEGGASSGTESPTNPSLSVVVPAYNEEAVIADCVRSLDDVLGGAFANYEIIVVDDGSTDGTAQVLAELVTRFPRLVVRHNARNRGLGSALRRGLASASGELVLYTDADSPFDFGTIPDAVRRLVRGRLDLLIGRRFSRSAEPPIRFIYSAVYNALIRRVFAVAVRDVNFACKLVRREVLDTLELRSNGSFIDAELVVRAISQGYRLGEFDVEALARRAGSSSAAAWPVIAKILVEMIWLLPSMKLGRNKGGPASWHESR